MKYEETIVYKYLRSHNYCGKERSATKETLTRVLGMNERAVRNLVSKERSSFPIIATSDGSGYYIAANTEECEHFIAEIRSRIVSLEESLSGTIKYLEFLKELNPEQPTLF